jgi:ATP-binding cassette subfamily B protein
MKHFPFFKQMDSRDCGPTCLKMIARFYGRNSSLQTLRERCSISKTGSSLLGISEAAESIGFHSTGVKITMEQLLNKVPLPCILHWKQQHFVVCYAIKYSKKTGPLIYIADPASGMISYTQEELASGWLSMKGPKGDDMGIALLLNPGPDFYALEEEKAPKKGLWPILNYFNPYKKFVVQLLLGMLAASVLQLLFPFLTQAWWISVLEMLISVLSNWYWSLRSR